ncbi:ATP-binding cassette domain-containing protein [Woeseia oceani]|nr:ATP-binding cassette domain-containing protein [Woeseia oceani]
MIFMLGGSITTALSPVLLKTLVDALSKPHGDYIGVAPIVLVFAYALAHYLARSFTELRAAALGRAEQRIHRLLSDECFRHILSLPLRFHLRRQTGALDRILSNGLIGYRVILLHLINSVLPIMVEAAGMGVVLVFLGHSGFLVIFCVSVMLYALAFRIGAVRIRGPAGAASSSYVNAGAVFTDSLLNYETIKMFNGEARVRGRFRDALRDTEGCWAEVYKQKMRNGLTVAAIFTLSLGMSLSVGTIAVVNGTMSIGDFVLVNAYAIQLVMPLERIGFAFRDIAQGIAFVGKLAELFQEEPEPYGITKNTASGSGPKALVFDHVSFGYDPDRPILRDVSFHVPPGGTLAVVGTSGSGKSSLIRLLLRLVEPNNGRIFLGGTDLTDIPLAYLRKDIAVVPQEPVMFNDSIAFNIAFARAECDHDDIVAAAKIANIHDFILGLPDGYQTKVGERGVRLSGGEKQRLAIARAVISKAGIYVFDEATSALDSNTRREVLGSLVDATENATTIIIAHRLSVVTRADEIVVLEEGRIVEQGTHDILLQSGGSYSLLWWGQQSGAVQERPGRVS